MKKPRRPKAGKNQPQPQQPIQPQKQKGLFAQVLQTWWGRIVAGFAAIGSVHAFLSTYDSFHSLYTDTIPEIHVTGDDQYPFILPFRVKNNSHFFSMVDVTWTCGIKRISNDRNANFSNFGVSIAADPITIYPMKDTTFRCPIGIDKDMSADIRPIVKYKTLGFDREFNMRRFVWYPNAHPPRWVESDTN